VLVFALVLIAAPVFMFVLVAMPPTISPGLSSISMPSVRRLVVHSVKIRLANADLSTAIVTAAFAADQRDVFNAQRGG
jgi:hypothetical protein